MSIIITGGHVFDGTGTAPFPGEVVIDGDRITEVRQGHHPDRHEGHEIIDATGCTVMPGLVESHAHITFPSAVGHIDPRFNPPLDMSFFGAIEGFPSELARAERNAAILLDAGFTSAYSAGSLLPMPTELALRDKLAAGVIPGPRFLACAAERDAVPRGPVERPEDWGTPEAVAEWVRSHAEQGYDSVKLLLSNDDVFVEGGSQITQYTEEQARIAGETAREHGVWLASHCQSAESVKLAVRSGFRSIYHCSYADEEALDLLEAAKDFVFVSPAPGIIWANINAGEEFGIDAAMAEQMGSVACYEQMREVYPKMRERGIRVLPGGDYGFPNNPIGRNAHDLTLFVEDLGYSPIETLVAATRLGGELMDMGDELGVLADGYLADVLVVTGDPTEDVSVLEDADNLRVIMQGGSLHKQPAAH
ncbi:MAG: amidohydrolase family protein [Acidimicrobiales bacterium]